jgi:hypothetical protein
MSNLPRFTLAFDQQKEDWALRNDMSGRTVRRFETKDDATKGGVLEDAVGNAGGSVRIHKLNGMYDEERTYPRSRDPRSSKG